jgi:hypothetical protein
LQYIHKSTYIHIWLFLIFLSCEHTFLIDQNPPTLNRIILDVIKLCLSFNQDHMSISNFLSVLLFFFLLNANRSSLPTYTQLYRISTRAPIWCMLSSGYISMCITNDNFWSFFFLSILCWMMIVVVVAFCLFSIDRD